MRKIKFRKNRLFALLLLCTCSFTACFWAVTVPSLAKAHMQTYNLLESTRHGEWEDSYRDYYCYAYAIDVTNQRSFNPGHFSNGLFNMNMSLEGMAWLVKDDLEALGFNYGYIFIEDGVVDVSSLLEPDEKIICIRKGIHDYLDIEDYHLMKYDLASNAWYHKPGWSGILKYNGRPSKERVWTNEYWYSYELSECAGDVTYFGDIYYIVYSEYPFITEDLSPTTVKIKGAKGMLQGRVDIPPYINGKKVVSIDENAFIDQVLWSETLIPASVTSIGVNAFANTGIWNNTANNSVVYAGKWAVGYKGSLSGVLSLKTDSVGIAYSAFAYCTGLTSVIIPFGVISIGSGAFQGCKNLQSMTLPFAGNTLNGTVNTHFGYIFGAPDHTAQYADIPSMLESVTIMGGNIAPDAFYGCMGFQITVLGSTVNPNITSQYLQSFYIEAGYSIDYVVTFAAYGEVQIGYSGPVGSYLQIYDKNDTQIQPYYQPYSEAMFINASPDMKYHFKIISPESAGLIELTIEAIYELESVTFGSSGYGGYTWILYSNSTIYLSGIIFSGNGCGISFEELILRGVIFTDIYIISNDDGYEVEVYWDGYTLMVYSGYHWFYIVFTIIL